MVQLIATIGLISVIIGGSSVLAGDTLKNILSEAEDTQRIANLRQISLALELYYLDYQKYPQVMEANTSERFRDLISQLSNYLASFPTGKKNYDYQDFNSGQNYILKTLLEDSKKDFGDQFQKAECQSPYYCIKM